MTASASSTCCRRRSGTAIRAAPSRPRRSSSPRSPNTYAALLKAIIDATAFATKAENRKQIAEAIAPANYLNQPVTVVEQVLTGTFADGLGNVKNDAEPHRFRSVPVGVVRGLDPDADEALGSDQGRRRLRRRRQAGLPRDRHHQADEGGRPDAAGRDVEDASSVMGKTFDPAKPEEYVKSFAIKRSA